MKFKPLIEDVDDKKKELERRVGVANDERTLNDITISPILANLNSAG